jgi:hypothetical protein
MNLLSLSYGELAQQLGISGDRARKREARPGWSRLRGGNGIPPADAVPPKKDQARPAAKSMTVLPPNKPAAEQVNRVDTRLALQDELGRAERLALAEQYNVVQERKKAAELRAEVQRLNARVRELQQAEEDRMQQPWWQRIMTPRPR